MFTFYLFIYLLFSHNKDYTSITLYKDVARGPQKTTRLVRGGPLVTIILSNRTISTHNNNVVKDWIIVVMSKKGYRLLSYVCPQRKYYTPYGKIFFQILWDCISVKAKLFIWACLKKKEKKRKYNGLTGRQNSLSRFYFSFRSSLKHRNTDPRNCNL